jgi:hypothetical protein
MMALKKTTTVARRGRKKSLGLLAEHTALDRFRYVNGAIGAYYCEHLVLDGHELAI